MNENNKLYHELMKAAIDARGRSYSPYSGFSVGAALLTKSGRIFTGANIENSGYTATVCAERIAFFRALSEGEREFSAIAIAGGAKEEPDSGVAPCGVCRQVMSEFCDGNFKIILLDGGLTVLTLGELLPMRFDRSNLIKK
ncbi:MAG: cytidine deaminase [Clostridia bacterium]|nr:cytidine deaminase [Clostridia bacterium]